MTTISSHRRSLGAAGVLAVSLTTLLAACGGGSTKAASARASTSPVGSSPAASGSATRAGGPGGRSFSGAAGSVAAITGSSMEVQNPSSGQTTVNWTAATTFAQTVRLAASALAAGECVTVTGSSSNGRITARSVAITAPSSSGTCPTGFGPGGRGGFGARAGRGNAPTGSAPTGSAPNGNAPGRFRAVPANAGFASGKVVSATAGSLVLYGSSFAGPRSPRTSVPPTTAAPADVTVTLAPSTVYTQVRPAAATSLAVGDCVVATGPADSTGAVTARSVRITSTGGQSCSAGFGRFAGAGAAPAGSAGANG